MNGSVMLVKAKDEGEVRELLRSHVYTVGGAWDIEKATIWPFHSG